MFVFFLFWVMVVGELLFVLGMFGYLLVQFGLIEDVFDSLIVLKDFIGIEGFLLLELIEEMDLEGEKKVKCREIE